MILPFLLICFAVVATAVVTYGMRPQLGHFPHGIEYIMTVRTWEWPLIALAIVLCLGLVGMVAAGKRRAWWLIGLLPVLGMIVYGFATNPMRVYSVYDAPAFVSPDKATWLQDGDYVVGLRFNKVAYAFPYYALSATPIVVHTDHDQRMVLFWSMYANRAVARQTSLDLHARDLQIVSMPANGLLVYDAKFGQYISGITGLTMQGKQPTNFLSTSIPTWKMTWKDWRTAHPDTQVMLPARSDQDPRRYATPQSPVYPLPPTMDTMTMNRLIVMVPGVLSEGTLPIGVAQDHLRPGEPLNAATPNMKSVLVLNPGDGPIRAFDRQVGDKQREFIKRAVPARHAVMGDKTDKTDLWDVTGKAVDGPLARQSPPAQLQPVPVDTDLYWGVMKTWVPDLRPVDAGP